MKKTTLKNCLTVRLLITAAVLFVSAFTVSCSSVMVSSDRNVNEQIKAENRIMKQNLMLVMRENSVIKDENFQYKSETGKLKTKVKLIESEMGSLKKKYDQDIALLNEKYDNLNKKNLILEQESSSKIRELTDMNKAVVDKMSGEINVLNESIRKQEENFNRERAVIETSFTAKELECQKQVAQLKQDIIRAGVELESAKSKLAESLSALDSAKKELQKKEDTVSELNLRIDELNAKVKNQELLQENKEGNP